MSQPVSAWNEQKVHTVLEGEIFSATALPGMIICIERI